MGDDPGHTYRLLTPEEKGGHTYRRLTPEEIEDHAREIGRRTTGGMLMLLLTPRQTAAKVGEEIRTDLSVVDIQDSQEPTINGRSLVDADPMAEVVGPDGIVIYPAVARDEQGCYHVTFAPSRPGMYTLSVQAQGYGAANRFQALP